MKNLNNLLLLLILLSTGTLMTSCSDDESKLASEITIDGEDIALENGYIVGFGSDVDDNGDAVSVYQIVLTDGGITATSGELSGTGTAIFLFPISPLTYELKDGNYTFEFSESLVKSNVFGFIHYNWDIEMETADESYAITGGTLNITKSGKTFKIKLSNLVLEKDSDGSEVDGKGSWEGSLNDQELVENPA
ncbi:MAG: hypothetical protein WAZ98_11270 [Cyclobacteriaceae bacterium]